MTTTIETKPEVKERPIIFSAPMVRAILAGQKTQTRRIMKPQPFSDWYPYGGMVEIHDMRKDDPTEHVVGYGFCSEDGEEGYACPYGKPGDRLWVRETLELGVDTMTGKRAIIYSADQTIADTVETFEGLRDKKPSMFMPRKYCRLTLEIVSVRVERVQDITAKDAIAEGIIAYGFRSGPFQGMRFWENYLDLDSKFFDQPDAPIKSFQSLWDSVNAKRGYSWESNPWTWAITFKRFDPA